MIREWIIFALCLGVGGHIALGIVLHAPDLWPLRTASFYGLLSGLLLYGFTQAVRVIWKMIRPTIEPSSSSKSDPAW